MAAHHKRKRTELEFERLKTRVLKYWFLVEQGELTRTEFIRRFAINPQQLEIILKFAVKSTCNSGLVCDNAQYI